MELECYPTTERPPDIVPGQQSRAWMDNFTARHPYRCLPLNMANTSGWEILSPVAFTAEWNGGIHQQDITLKSDYPNPDFHRLASSHFSHGVLTMHPGYLFRTPPGWSMWVMGPPNHIKDGIQALSGVVETDWLPFPFTMNWIFTGPGKVRFEKDEPFCFVNVVEHRQVDRFEPVIRSLESDPDLKDQYAAWSTSRAEFNQKLTDRDPATLKESWQRFYFKGEPPKRGGPAPADHINKRRLKTPEPKG
jgi:hypothetical protein